MHFPPTGLSPPLQIPGKISQTSTPPCLDSPADVTTCNFFIRNKPSPQPSSLQLSTPRSLSPIPHRPAFPTAIADGKFRREGFILAYTGPLTDYYDVDPKKLGQGTYGSVNKAVKKSTHIERAIKSIIKSKVRNVERFKQEIAIMKGLDHPNIVKLFETFEDHKNVYLVLELCGGGELFDRVIDQGYFSERYAAVLMRQILAAVYYCHSNGIVHRDLKPENFLFLNKSKESPLKIIDFGLACRHNGKANLSTKAGTPYYVAPQVLQGQYGKECDVWSVGVIMYILLCGYPPFYGESDAEILQKVKSGKFSFNEADWKNVSLEARDLIRKLIEFSPTARWTAEQALQHMWVVKYARKHSVIAEDIALNHRILNNFRTFRAVSKIQKAALTVIAQHLSESEIANLKIIFMVLDANGDGTLTVSEIQEGLTRGGLRDIPNDLDNLLKDVDSDGSGSIDYTEFIAAAIDKQQYIKEDVCWAAFRLFDLDGNGKISPEELLQVLGKVDLHGMCSISELDIIRSMIKEIDKNGDGEIDFNEFMDMLRARN